MLKKKLSELLSPAYFLFLITIVLLGFGLVMVYSASAYKAPNDRKIYLMQKHPEQRETILEDNEYHNTFFLQRQMIYALLGIFMLFLLYNRSEEALLKKYSTHFLVLSGILLLLVFSPLGAKSHGANRWIQIWKFTFQPSELAKLALIIFMAKYLDENRRKIKEFLGGFLPAVGIATLPLILILFEPDLGTTIVLGTIVFLMWFIGKMRKLHLLLLIGIGIIVCVIAVIMEPWRIERLMENPQVKQSLVAVGSGGLFGRGLGNGIMKYNFLSEAHCDFIFSIICEELGFIGGVFVATMFLLWVVQGARIAMKAPTYFSALLAAGITLMIGLPAFINMFVAIKLAPTKGLVLPFISYGGSSLLVCLTATGILLSIAKNKEVIDQEVRMNIGKGRN